MLCNRVSQLSRCEVSKRKELGVNVNMEVDNQEAGNHE